MEDGTPMNIDRWLAIAGLVAAVWSIWLARRYYVKSVRTKLLAISHTQPIPLMLPVGGVKVSYQDSEHSELSRVFLLLWNRGTSPIEGDDFLHPIAIGPAEKIVAVKVHDKDVATIGIVDIEAKTVSVSLLRPGEAIIFRIDAAEEAFKPDIAVEMKSADMSSSLVLERGLLPQVMAGATAIVVFFGSMIIDDPSPLSPLDYPSVLFSVIATLFLVVRFVVAAGLAYLVYRLARRWLTASTSPVAWRFFEIQVSVMQAHETWKKLKKQIDQSELK